jgi:hypothetical protein
MARAVNCSQHQTPKITTAAITTAPNNRTLVLNSDDDTFRDQCLKTFFRGVIQ